MRMHQWLGLCSVLALGACSQAPVVPAPAGEVPAATMRPSSEFESAREAAVASHRKLAAQHRVAGDLPEAETEWQIVVILAPDDPAARRELDQVRAAIRGAMVENLQAGASFQRAGDYDRATRSMLRVLALDPDNAEAEKALREMDQRKMARIQADRAGKVRFEEAGNAPARAIAQAVAPAPTSEAGDGYDLEQRLEMFKAGDVAGGLRELRGYVDAHPKDRAARNRIGVTVYERGADLEAKGNREAALGLYEQAVTLRGDALPQWKTQIQALKKALSVEYFDKGMRTYRTDLAGAIRDWETSARYDPQNLKATERLREARAAQEKLQKIDRTAAPR
jgi:tetratricopeptide (TPR) repeat protein